MYCPNCGLENKESSKFCYKCGTNLKSVREMIHQKATIEEPILEKENQDQSKLLCVVCGSTIQRGDEKNRDGKGPLCIRCEASWDVESSVDLGAQRIGRKNDRDQTALAKGMIYGKHWTRAILFFFSLCILVDMFAVVASYELVSMLDRAQHGVAASAIEAKESESTLTTIGNAQTGIYIWTALVFLCWFYYAHKNLTLLGRQGLKYSPKWAVGGFFVPFLNLVRPYNVAVEVWKASDPKAPETLAWQNTETSSLVGWWWFFFIIRIISSRVAESMITQAGEKIVQLVEACWVLLIAQAISIVAAVLAIIFVRLVNKRQVQCASELDSLL